MTTRRSSPALLVSILSFLSSFAAAQSDPTKPVRVVVSVPAGGTPDVCSATVGRSTSCG